MADDVRLQELRNAVETMRGFVDGGNWRRAPWAEGTFTECFVEDVKQCSLFVDIGADVGFYSYLALQNMPTGGRIVVFEPEPLRNAVLRELFAPYQHVRLFDFAVDCVKGTKQFVRPTVAGWPCATSADIEGERFTVNTIRLDELMGNEAVDIIKMDIEGAEANALVGMKETIARSTPKIYFEVHPYLVHRISKNGVRHMEELLIGGGYSLFNCDYGELVATRRIVGARLFACHRDTDRTAEGSGSSGYLRNLYLGAKVRGWLPLRGALRKMIVGY